MSNTSNESDYALSARERKFTKGTRAYGQTNIDNNDYGRARPRDCGYRTAKRSHKGRQWQRHDKA